MEVKLSKEKALCIMEVSGRMDAVTAPDFQREMEERLEAGERCFLIDLGLLEYISSAGLRSMLFLAKKLKPMEGTVVLCGLGGVVKEVFDISGFSTIFTICTDRAEALTKL
ncbi:MAG: hypothetical protein A2512_09325 [Deltaproteobacteria bacterium RIFOXYD12_FULL_56_24]|nr:MAG: hypothetical protein A2512_09325 [Deltaproteobacteria bacterium RIFOXYD12_FULL_56_24]